MNEAKILEKLGIADSDKKLQDLVLESVNNIVELRVGQLIEDSMDDEQTAMFDKMVAESKSHEEIMKWVSAEVVNVEELREAVLSDYLDEKTKK